MIKRKPPTWTVVVIYLSLSLCVSLFFTKTWAASPLDYVVDQDILVVTDHTGKVIIEKNRTKIFVPASILKIYTALAAFHYLGPCHRFETELYWRSPDTLKVKGYGDPLMISEVWENIAGNVARKKKKIHTIVLDDRYFLRGIHVPGSGQSTNPYDAPLGALCANFNTVFFKRNNSGEILSAEPQTPMTPLAMKRIGALGKKMGRYTFSHRQDDIVLYAGEILAFFLNKNGVTVTGNILSGSVDSQDHLLFTHGSGFTLEEVVRKMLEFSNNFMANQLTVAMGAQEYGPPGSMAKGVGALARYGQEILHLQQLALVEGSGISRKNRLSAEDMLIILKAFEPYRHLLVKEGPVQYKTGTLSGIRTRAGYIEGPGGKLYTFVVALKSNRQMIRVMDALQDAIHEHPTSQSSPDALQ